MPTYTYNCSVCNHTFNLFHSIKDDSTKNCPLCGNVAYRRLGTGIGIIFKGSGFYETDYKKKGKNGSTHLSHSKNIDEISNSTDFCSADTTTSSTTDKKPESTAPKKDTAKAS